MSRPAPDDPTVQRQRHISNVVGLPGFPDNHRKMGRLRCELINCELGEVLDLSRTGMRVRLNKRTLIKDGETLAVVINGPGARFEIGATVVWIKKSGLFSSGEAGLEFSVITEAAQSGFSALVRSIMA